MTRKPIRKAALAVIPWFLTLTAGLQAAPPDARTDYIDTTHTYNLGPTGARGWIYSTGNEWLFTPEGLTTESRQILVTQVAAGSPAAGILQVNDVILGASGTAADPVDFTSDARKSLGLAIGEAEKTANAGHLKLKVWRGGVTQNVQLTLQVMGTYSATAPFSCPKSTAIITKACTLLASHPINSGYTEGNAVIGLALLACVAPTDPYYATVQSKVQTYARAVAAQNLDLTIPVNAMVAWPWGYTNVFLSEYYLATGDAQVLPAIRELTATCAAGQSLFGTYGHGMAWSKSDGSSTHGYVPTYGPVNQAGETVNLGIMLGRKALVAAGELATLDPEIDPAIERGRKYFAYFAGKGAVPYGHSPPEDLHDDNGKSGLASLLMVLQDQADMSTEARYFAKSCTAAYNLREMGHCGPYWAHLWQPLGVQVGGPDAMAAYFKEIQWELDMTRRWDGSFAYHSADGAAADATGLGPDSDTACFLLTYATALKRIYITGKDQSSSNYINASDITEAITDGVYSLRTDLDTLTSDQLVAALGSWSPQKRNWAAAELATRGDAGTKVATLLAMAADLTNLHARKGACQALGQIKPASAATVLRDRLTDSDYHVRYYAAEALRAMGATAQPVLNDMLTTIVSSARPIEPINWNDPYQIAYSYLGSAAFEGQLGGSVASVSTGLLYPAITSMSQSLGRNSLISTFENALSLANVQALAPVITTALLSDHTICNEWLARSCIRTLAKYNVDEGIPAAMIFENFESGRSWLPSGTSDSENALKKYGATAAATLPALEYWKGQGLDLAATIATIQNDTSTHTLVYFKSISTCTANPTTVALPLGVSSLSATAADIDGNGAALVYTWSKLRGAGAVTFSPNGTTASKNCTAMFDTPGTYIIRLGVTDGVLDPNKYGPVTRDLTITVVADPNRPPVAINQNVTTAQDTAKTITLAATDADGNALTYSVVTGPASGALSGTPPDLTYTPAAGFTGNTSFTFKANDGTVDSGIATVTLAVGTSGNTTPVAQNQSLTTAEDTAKAVTLTGTDADSNPLTYSIVTPPAHGALSGTLASRTYTPTTNFTGTDSFTFTVSDGTATSGAATVVISVTAVNDAPSAIAQSLSTPEDTAIPITLAGTDPEGYAITYKLTASPTHGTLTGVAPNLTYTPASLYNGADSLAFTVTDSEGVISAAATVAITVTPINQAPVALNRSLPVAIGTATAIVLSGTDADNNPLTYTVLSQPAHGTLTGTAPNLTFTPVAGFDSTDSFTFKVNDGTADSDIATVFLSMGAIYTGVASEFYQNPPNLYTWPDMAHLLPSDTRTDTRINFAHADFPPAYEDHFSSRHTGYLKITTAGYYTFSTSADDNTRVFVDETYVLKTIYGQAGWSLGPRYLTAGYHGIRVEFVETYGDNYLYLNWSGPGVSGTVPASAFWRCVGSTAPVVPTNLTATPLDSAVALAWSLSPFATTYTVKRATAAGGPYTDFPDVATTSYRDAAVTNGTTYYYVVTATGAGGTSFISNEVSATPVTAPVTVNLDYHGSSAIYMNGTASNSAASSGTASRVAPWDYDGVNAASVAVNFWNSGTDGNAALTNLKNSEGVTQTGLGVSALLIAHGSANDWGGLGEAPNGARLLKGGLQLSRSPNLLDYTTLFKVTGLNTSHIYQLALASQYYTDDRSTSYRVGLVQDTVENGGAATDWTAGLNYAVLDNLVPNSAGEIHVQAKVNGDWAPLNGWQLVDKGVRTAGANTYTTMDSCTFGALGAGKITDSNITLTVPFGSAISTLTPTIVAAAGATISPSTPQNFNSPVTYRVTAENGGNYQDYTVTLTVAPNVTFTQTALAVTAAAEGTEILSTGTLIAANHFFSTAATVTLSNGLIFGTDWSHTTPTGLSAGHQRTDADAHNHVPLLNGSTAFGKLMRSYAWSSETTHKLDIPGLTPGHTYRLQLVSTDGASARVSVEQATAVSLWSGNNKLLTAGWTQGPGDYVANVVLTRTGGPELETTAYALHDVTPGFQPSPAELLATAGDGQISLSWAAAPGATGYTVKRSTVTGGPYTTIANPAGITFLNTGLTNGIRYYYVVTATTALGETPNSAQASALPTAPAAPPAAPTLLAATPGSNTVGLTWTGASGATGYHVKRSLSNGGPTYTLLGSTGGTSYNDATAVNGTTYYYVVSATNGAGEGGNSSQVSATPSAQPSATTLASAPVATGAYGATVTFTATVTVSGGPATGTVTFKDGATVLGTGTLAAGTATFATSTLAVGSHSITATYGGDSIFATSVSGPSGYEVSAKTVTITGVTASNKEYDATATAVLTVGSVSGVVAGETVTVTAGGGAFASPNAGTWAVTASGFALGGAHAGNYTLAAQPAVANATISARPVQLTGTRAYDGTAVATANLLTIANNLDGADLTMAGSANLADRHVGPQAVATVAAAARVQSAGGNTGTNAATTISVTLGTAPVAGNTLIAVISTRGTIAGRVTGITQSGAAWSRAAQATNANGTTTEIWYAPNVAGAGTAITINQASLRSAALVMEYAGVAAVSPLDQTNNATGNSTAAATGTTATTAQPNELWIGGIGFVDSARTLGTPLNSFTSVNSAQSTNGTTTNNAKVYALERVMSATGTAASGGTVSGTALQWSGAIATFKTVTPTTLVLTGAAAANYTLAGATGSVQVTAKNLGVTGLSASNRHYDGTAVAGLAGTPVLAAAEAAGTGSSGDGKPYSGDTLTLGGLPTGAFADKHAGNLKPVTVGGITLGGAHAGNYTLTPPSGLTATITPLPITVSAVSATKTYDGTTAVPGTPELTPALVSGDAATVLSQAFQDPNAGSGNKVIVPSITLDDGHGGANYQVTLANCGTGTITPAAATVTLGGLAQFFDGTPKTATATTVPAGLAVSFTYDGASTAPTNPGSYAVVATIGDSNYTGTAGGTLVIGLDPLVAWQDSHFTPAEITAGLAADGVDADGDGIRNRDEYTLGTDPRSFTAQPLVLTPPADDHFTLSFLARSASGSGYAGRTRKYDVESSSDLANPASWQAVAGHTGIVGADQDVTISLPVDAPQQFYRLSVRVE